MSSSLRKRLSMSKQRGAEMSSRLMPPKTGAIADTIRTISSASFVARHTGQASIPPNSLNRIALPSMTGSAASGPMSPEPEHGAAVGHDSDGVVLDGQVPDLRGIVRDRLRDTGDTRRVRHRKVIAGLQRSLRDDLELAAQVHQERPVGDVLDLHPVERANGLDDAIEVPLVRREHADVSDLLPVLDADEVDRVQQASGLADRLGEECERARSVREMHPECRAEGGGRMRRSAHGLSVVVVA